MPSFEGIEVAIVTQPELTKLAEFPLSDTSSQRVLWSDNQLSRPTLAGSSRLRSRLQQLQKTSPRISVYIPSDPGSRFGIHYELHETSQLPRSPSGGLLDSPEEACYYDWLLIDSKESPYVSFRFHYRSLLNLRRLSLAPDPSELAGISIDTGEDIVEDTSEESISTKSESDNTSSGEQEPCLSTQARRLTEIAPLVLPPKASSARPLPEIPVKKAVNQGDVEKQVMDHEYTSLSDIQEEIEHTDTSITASLSNLPDRCLSPRSIKARVLELNDCGIIPPQSALKRDTSSTILESLVNYSELPEPLQNRALSTSAGKMSGLTSEMKSILAEAEDSFRTGWRLSESEWMKGDA
ncbi:hypothetical protein IL306_001733 [Fusarium sp. DS 682]|nr:hypothetical protein IL306_001733 [Fusarium sp. DS 682]